MNWGKGIVIAMTTFIAFIVVLVVILMTRNIDLESEDYYQQEISYQNEIEALKNAKQLKEKVDVSVIDKQVVLQVPDNLNCQDIKVILSRPNNKDLDRTYSIEDSKNMVIKRSELTDGIYNISITYTLNDKEYLQKEAVNI